MKITIPVYAKFGGVEYDLGTVDVELEVTLKQSKPPVVQVKRGLSPAAAQHLLDSMAP